MKLTLKILLGFLFIGLLMAAVVVWNANSIAKTFRPQLETMLSQAINAPLSFGEIDLKFFPRIAIRLNDLSIKSSPDNEGETSSVKALLLSSSPLDIMRGRLSVSEIGVENANVSIRRKADGTLTIAGIPLAQAARTNKNENNSSTEAGGTPISINIDAVQVVNTSLNWIDETVTPTAKLTISDINTRLDEIDLAGKARIELSAKAFSDNAKSIQLNGILGNPLEGFPSNLSLDLNDISLKKLNTTLETYDIKLEKAELGETFSLSTNISMEKGSDANISANLDASSSSIVFENILDKKAGTTLKINLSATASLLGDISAKTATLALGNLSLNAPFNIGKDSISLNLSSQDMSLADLSTILPMLQPFGLEGKLKSNIYVSMARSGAEANKPKMTGQIELQDVGAKVSAPSKEGSNSPALTVNKINGQIALAQDTISSKKISLAIAEQNIDLGFKVSSLTNPLIAAVISTNKLNVWPLVSPFAPTSKALQTSSIEDMKITATYGTENQSGNVSILAGNAQLAGIEGKNIKVAVMLKPETIFLKPSSLDAFSGNIELQGYLKQNPQQDFEVALKGLNLDSSLLSNALMPTSKISLSGTMDHLTINAKAEAQRLMPTLASSTRFAVSNGAIEGVNIAGQALAKINQIPGLGEALSAYIPEKHRGIFQSSDTAFTKLISDISIRDEIMSLSTMLLEHPLYIISGHGDINFNGSLKLKTQLKLTPLLAKSMVLSQPKLALLLDEGDNIVIPVVITRQNESTLVVPDTTELFKRAAKNTAKEAAQRQIEKLIPGAGGAAKVLDSLFK
ncbi:MAG: DUF748 domain-containing protein [Deltaproteobacteria bacterium]|nr:DUF748 domain-containing protein [Deltaproteobacteria bacterium]